MKKIIFLILISLIFFENFVFAANVCVMEPPSKDEYNYCCYIGAGGVKDPCCWWKKDANKDENMVTCCYSFLGENPPCQYFSLDEIITSTTSTPALPIVEISESPSQPKGGGDIIPSFKPGKVTVRWGEVDITICPPGIFGSSGCSYPDLIAIIRKINDFLLNISPPLLVVLIILGGLMYLLTPFNVEEYIRKGHNYIKYAIFGYILLLLVTLVFSIIRAILGGPSS